jgi:transcription antitermination factor NusG
MEQASTRSPAQGCLRCYALRVRPRHEKSVALALEQQGYEQYLPLYERRYRWAHANSCTVRVRRLPLFPTYVFCRFDPDRSLPIVKTPGVRKIVSFARNPVPLAEDELAAVKRITGSGCAVAPHAPLDVGSYVRIRKGPLSGLEGFLERVKGCCHLVVGVSLLHRAVSVEIDPDWVVPAIPPAGTTSPSGSDEFLSPRSPRRG